MRAALGPGAGCPSGRRPKIVRFHERSKASCMHSQFPTTPPCCRVRRRPEGRCFARTWAANGLQCDDPRFTSQTLGRDLLSLCRARALASLVFWPDAVCGLGRLRVGSGHSCCNHQILRGTERRMMHGSTLWSTMYFGLLGFPVERPQGWSRRMRTSSCKARGLIERAFEPAWWGRSVLGTRGARAGIPREQAWS